MELKNTSKLELISFFCPYNNLNKNICLPTTAWRHPTTSFLILILLPSLLFSSISTTFAFTTEPTPISVLIRFFSFIHLLIVTTGDLIVYFEWGNCLVISVTNSKCGYDFLCKKGIPTKKINQKKKPGSWEPTTSHWVNQMAQIPQVLTPLIHHKPYHLNKIKNYFTVVYTFHFQYLSKDDSIHS